MSTAIHRRSLLVSKTILAIIVSGTETSAPIGPQSQPQNTMARSTTRGERPRVRPITFGSMTLPTMALITR